MLILLIVVLYTLYKVFLHLKPRPISLFPHSLWDVLVLNTHCNILQLASSNIQQLDYLHFKYTFPQFHF